MKEHNVNISGQELGRKQNSLQMVQINRPEWWGDFRVGAWGGRQGFGNKWRRARNQRLASSVQPTGLPWKEEKRKESMSLGRKFKAMTRLKKKNLSLTSDTWRLSLFLNGYILELEGRLEIVTAPSPPSVRDWSPERWWYRMSEW